MNQNKIKLKKQKRESFIKSPRLLFSFWTIADILLAEALWMDEQVVRYIQGNKTFTKDEIAQRLTVEISNQKRYGVQYWPLFTKDSESFVGVCGLRPYEDGKRYELGVHLKPEFWGQQLASEACLTVIKYAFETRKFSQLVSGHHPNNSTSKNLLLKLGFIYVEELYYQPTGVLHPSYLLKNPHL